MTELFTQPVWSCARYETSTDTLAKATIFSAINLIVTLLVMLQLWLLTATMNAWLGGDSSVVWPAALASLGCLLLNLWLLRRLFYLQEPGG